MKKNAMPELNAKWWRANAPEGLSSAGGLEAALSSYEDASARLKTDLSTDACDECLDALADVDAAAEKARGDAEKCVKTPPKKSTASPDDFQNTADALKKYSKLVDAARREVEERADEARVEEARAEEQDETPGMLADEAAYGKYLKRLLPKLKKAPLNFAVGLGAKPDEHRIVFHKSKAGKALITLLKDETDLKKITWGIAGGHAEEKTTLTLALEGKQLPGLKKQVELLLKHHKPLPFDTILLMVDGVEAQDIEESAEEPAAVFNSRFGEVLPAIKRAVVANHPQAEQAKQRAVEAGNYAKSDDFANAHRQLDEVERLLKAQPSAANAPADHRLADALSDWRSVRAQTIATLKEIAKEIAGSGHADTKDSLLELNAVIRQLSAEPDTPQKVAELERYLNQDDVVLDVSEIAQDIRTPLLSALTRIKAYLAA